MDYYFLIAGSVAGLISYFILLKGYSAPFKRTAVYAAALTVAFGAMRLILAAANEYLYSQNNRYYSSGYSFYITAVLFIAIYSAVSRALNIDNIGAGRLTALPLICFLAPARLGCYFTGCCGGSIGGVSLPFSLMEATAAVGAGVLILKGRLYPGKGLLTAYTAARFVADFFKYSYEFETVGLFTFSQLIYILVLAAVLVVSVYGRQKDFFQGRLSYED